MKNRDNREQRIKSLLMGMGMSIEARATSTSGRWRIYLGEHLKKGLPCFDVILINTDLHVRVDHFSLDSDSVETYDACRDQAKTEARKRYEDLVEQLQQKAKSELADEDSGMTVIGPEGQEEKFVN